MSRNDLIRQVSLEHQLLGHITQAVRGTMDWSAEGEGLSRKLSTVRFVVQSFQRHLDRLLTLEEQGGFMDLLLDCDSQRGARVEDLKQQHDQFREALKRVIPRLERVSPGDHAEFASVCDRIRNLLDRIDSHCLAEMFLVQECSSQFAAPHAT
jgi:uncharacterized protein YhaN